MGKVSYEHVFRQINLLSRECAAHTQRRSQERLMNVYGLIFSQGEHTWELLSGVTPQCKDWGWEGPWQYKYWWQPCPAWELVRRTSLLPVPNLAGLTSVSLLDVTLRHGRVDVPLVCCCQTRYSKAREQSVQTSRLTLRFTCTQSSA